jgi:hypothetical protein
LTWPQKIKGKQKKVEVGLAWASKPNQPNLIWAKCVFGKTHPYADPLYFIPFCFDIRPNKLFLDIRKFQKNLGIFVGLFMGPSYLFCVVLITFAVYLIYRL